MRHASLGKRPTIFEEIEFRRGGIYVLHWTKLYNFRKVVKDAT